MLEGMALPERLEPLLPLAVVLESVFHEPVGQQLRALVAQLRLLCQVDVHETLQPGKVVYVIPGQVRVIEVFDAGVGR